MDHVSAKEWTFWSSSEFPWPSFHARFVSRQVPNWKRHLHFSFLWPTHDDSYPSNVKACLVWDQAKVPEFRGSKLHRSLGKHDEESNWVYLLERGDMDLASVFNRWWRFKGHWATSQPRSWDIEGTQLCSWVSLWRAGASASIVVPLKHNRRE